MWMSGKGIWEGNSLMQIIDIYSKREEIGQGEGTSSARIFHTFPSTRKHLKTAQKKPSRTFYITVKITLFLTSPGQEE